MFSTLIGAEIATYETFNENNGYNVDGFLKTVKECGIKNKKVFVVLNFPNNPTGYTLPMIQNESEYAYYIETTLAMAYDIFTELNQEE